MTVFIIRRLFWTIPVVLLVVFMTFALMRQVGGSPFRQTERAVPEAIMRNLEQQYGLDKPWFVQYLLYVKGVATFDLGPSMVLRNRTVNDIVKDHFPNSLQLGGLAFLFAVVTGIPLGVAAALRHNTAVDYGAMVFANVGFAVPNFLLGTLFIYLFALRWGDTFGLPTSGWATWKHKVLPVIALGTGPMAIFARIVRGTMLETLQQDYVRTAKAKGLRWRRIVLLHVLRNSLIPVVTFIGTDFGYLLGGAIVTETIFNIPGIGRAVYEAVTQREGAVVVGLITVLVIVFLVANLLVDVLYGVLDPRIRYE